MSFETSALPSAVKCDVLVVGAGPVGALAGLMLVQRGFKVLVIEKSPQTIPSPRALVYHPPVNVILEEVGLLSEIKKLGLVVDEGLVWRKASDHSAVGVIDLHTLTAEDYPPEYARELVLLGQHIFTGITLDKYKEVGGLLWFEHSFEHYEQNGSEVQVMISNSKGEESIVTTKFLIGADGGHSNVRKAIGQHLDGFTWDMPLMAVNFRYPDIHCTGFTKMQFMQDPQEDTANSNWSIVIHTGTDDIWRCAYGDDGHFTDQELKDRVHMKLKKILPGHPDPDKYEITLAHPYKIHQRCVKAMAKGRVLLCGDSAHLNNPAGGVGMNTGLLDAAAAVAVIDECLKLDDEQQVEQRTQKYSDLRREAFNGFTDPVTTQNLRRLVEKSDEADKKLRGEYYESLKDPQFQRQMHLGTNKMALGVPGF